MFFSSHVLSEVERISDGVGIIRDGRLVDVERIEALVSKAFRHVRLSFAEPVDWRPIAAFRGSQRPEDRWLERLVHALR